jgi:hypothetical protein
VVGLGVVELVLGERGATGEVMESCELVLAFRFCRLTKDVDGGAEQVAALQRQAAAARAARP